MKTIATEQEQKNYDAEYSIEVLLRDVQLAVEALKQVVDSAEEFAFKDHPVIKRAEQALQQIETE